MRLTPGGMSAREADDLSSQLDDIMAELTDQAYQRDADQQGERDARGQIVERVSAMLQNAGFTPANARMQAELIAQRESSRASRMGRELTGKEFGTEVVSVLPPALAEIQKADGLDLVVTALRKGKPATKQRGKSLLEWIAARGGVEDVGGDIASMGGDKWHLLEKAVTGTMRAEDFDRGRLRSLRSVLRCIQRLETGRRAACRYGRHRSQRRIRDAITIREDEARRRSRNGQVGP